VVFFYHLAEKHLKTQPKKTGQQKKRGRWVLFGWILYICVGVRFFFSAPLDGLFKLIYMACGAGGETQGKGQGAQGAEDFKKSDVPPYLLFLRFMDFEILLESALLAGQGAAA
jgi:hypothetical protein